MNLKRIHLKFFLEDSQTVSPETAFKIFNNWIAETEDEVLIDVADYSHVHAGPITLLVGHQADYSIDNADEKMGLLYCTKEKLEGDLTAQLRQAVVAALKACRRLEEDPLLEGRAKFRGGELALMANDRLNAPNTSAALATVKSALETVLGELYGGTGFTVENISAPDRLITLHARSEAEFGTADLVDNIGA